MPEITFPGPSPYGNQLRHDAVREAITELGIRDDVVVEWFDLSVRPGIAGDHQGQRDRATGQMFHLIHLSVWDDPATTSETLWHELEHARQNEALGYVTYSRAYRFAERVGSDADNPFERQAREVAERHVEIMLTDSSTFDPTVPDAAWRSMEALLATGRA